MENNKKITVFIVEDNVMYSKILKKALETRNYEVQVFHTGEEMISAWEEDPDIILLDYFINPEHEIVYMNGEKILRFIRRISRSLPVIVLTASDDALTASDDISRATRMLKLGAIDFIVKGQGELPNLERTITQVIETRRLREEMQRNKMQMKKYRQRFLVIFLSVALAAMTLLWLYS